MKKNLLSLLSIFFAATLCLGLSSCGDSNDSSESGDDSSASALVKKLMSSKWTNSGSDINEYSYGWSYETETYTLYFLDEKTGIEYWSYTDKDTDLGTSKNSGVDYFTYYVTGNKIVIRYEKGGGLTLEDHGSYIGEGNDQSDWYASQSLTSSDKSQMKEWLDSRGYKDAINKYVHGVLTKIDDINLSLKITSTLGSYYPNKKIKYLVVVSEYSHGRWNETETYGWDYSDELYLENLYFCGDINFGIYFRIYQALQEKIANGETLTDDEKELLKEVKPILTDMVKNIDFDIYVEINGNRYSFPLEYEYGSSSGGGGSSDTTSPIVGQWRMDFGQNSYIILTFNKDGSGRYYEYDHNKVEEDSSFNYTYADGWVTIKGAKPVQVTDLSSTAMTIKDWPDGGSNTFKKIK